jgi:hypothetical protein
MFSSRPSHEQGRYNFCGHSNEVVLLSSPALKAIVVCFQAIDCATEFSQASLRQNAKYYSFNGSTVCVQCARENSTLKSSPSLHWYKDKFLLFGVKRILNNFSLGLCRRYSFLIPLVDQKTKR